MSIFIDGVGKPKTCGDCMRDGIRPAVSALGALCPCAERIISPLEFNIREGVHPDCPIHGTEKIGRCTSCGDCIYWMDDIMEDPDLGGCRDARRVTKRYQCCVTGHFKPKEGTTP